jgi:lactate dehydrogenase-like 2-hydroxyacid dehydrogenase
VATIAVIGAGHIGSNVAKAAVQAGYDVIVSNATGPQSLASLVSQLGSKARAATVEEAAEAGDVVVVSVPAGASPPSSCGRTPTSSGPTCSALTASRLRDPPARGFRTLAARSWSMIKTLT